MNRKNPYCFLILLLAAIFVSTGIKAADDERQFCPAKIYLKTGECQSGYVEQFETDAKKIDLFSGKNGDGSKLSYASDQLLRIELYNANKPSDIHILEYLKLKKKMYWFAKMAEGPHLKTYILALKFNVNIYGKLLLIGEKLVIRTWGNTPGSFSPMTIPQSFPIYMKRENDSILTAVGLHNGIKFEDSALRGGITRYLSDDRALCNLIRSNKLRFDDISLINKLYIPSRKDEPLTCEGAEMRIKEEEFFTNYFDRELVWKLEMDKPTDGNFHGTQIRLGLQSSFYKYITYGGELGYGSAVFVDYLNLPPNFNKANDHLVDGYFKRSHGMLLNVFMGVQLPMKCNHFYLIPGVNVGLGALIAEANQDIATPHYAPTVTIDFGLKTSGGSVLFLGAGYRHIVPLVSQEAKERETYSGFSYYHHYSSLFLRVGFMF